MTEAITRWIESTQFSTDGIFTPSGFDHHLPIYETPHELSFVLAVIDGTSQPLPFSAKPHGSRYDRLIDAVIASTHKSGAFWFYGYDPDNALSVLSWVRACYYECASEYNLNSFETSPAPEGGVSWLGLLDADKKWMLLHTLNPCNEFRIDFHGTPSICDTLSEMLELPPENCGSPRVVTEPALRVFLSACKSSLPARKTRPLPD